MKPTLSSLVSLDPLFAAFPDSLQFAKQVHSFSRQGAPRDRSLLVALSGVYLLKRKAFPRVLFIRKQICLKALSALTVGADSFTVEGGGVDFAVGHPKALKLAARIYALRIALYGHPNLPFALSCDPASEATIRSFAHASASPLADRFLSCARPLLNAGNVAEAVQAHEKLKAAGESFPLEAGSFAPALCEALSYDSQIRELILTDFAIGPHLLGIAKNSRSIHRITFCGLRFAHGNFSSIREFLLYDGLLELEEFIFERCDFGSDTSESFFELFPEFKRRIGVLSFQHCIFGRQPLDGLFQAIFFSKSFHSLSTLLLSDVQAVDLPVYLSMLSLCEWVVTTHCLGTVSLVNCALEVGRLLPEMLKCDPGFVNLDFSGNSFVNPLPTNLRLGTISVLDVSKCTFTPTSFLSLVHTLGTVSDHDVRLIAASLHGLDDGAYAALVRTRIPNLISLVWDGNPLSRKNCAAFCAFAKNQPKLVDLSLAGCLAPDTAPLVGDLFAAMALESVNLSNNAIGPAIGRILGPLLKSPRLCALDISGNLVGEVVIAEVLAAKPASLADFRFAKFACVTADTLLAIVHTIIDDAHIRASAWPQIDAEQFPDAPGLAEARAEFAKRFSEAPSNGGPIKARVVVQAPAKPAAKSPTKALRSPSGSVGDNLGRQRTVEYDSETMEMLHECGDVLGDDPVDVLLATLRAETAIPKVAVLLKTLPKTV
jgi:hypothetical protein